MFASIETSLEKYSNVCGNLHEIRNPLNIQNKMFCMQKLELFRGFSAAEQQVFS